MPKKRGGSDLAGPTFVVFHRRLVITVTVLAAPTRRPPSAGGRHRRGHVYQWSIRQADPVLFNAERRPARGNEIGTPRPAVACKTSDRSQRRRGAVPRPIVLLEAESL
jgi:hypothetical protein